MQQEKTNEHRFLFFFSFLLSTNTKRFAEHAHSFSLRQLGVCVLCFRPNPLKTTECIASVRKKHRWSTRKQGNAELQEELMDACRKGDLVSFEKAVEKGANVHLADISSRHPLLRACLEGETIIVDRLLELGVDVNAQDRMGGFALFDCSREGHSDIVDRLLDRGASTNLQTLNGQTALFMACMKGHVDIVDRLLRAGSNTNLQNKEGASPLMIASEKGYVSVIDRLYTYGADIYATDSEGNTAIHYACKGNRLEALERLFSLGLTFLVNHQGVDPFMLACLHGHINLFEMLLANGATVNSVAEDGSTPLVFACKRNQERVIHFLFDHGADPQLTSGQADKPMTPLSFSCKRGMSRTSELLIQLGAQVNFQMPSTGQTALMVACASSESSTVSLLLRNGADPDLQDNEGRKAKDLCPKNVYLLSLLDCASKKRKRGQ